MKKFQKYNSPWEIGLSHSTKKWGKIQPEVYGCYCTTLCNVPRYLLQTHEDTDIFAANYKTARGTICTNSGIWFGSVAPSPIITLPPLRYGLLVFAPYMSPIRGLSSLFMLSSFLRPCPVFRSSSFLRMSSFLRSSSFLT